MSREPVSHPKGVSLEKPRLMFVKRLALAGVALITALVGVEMSLRLAGYLYLNRYYSHSNLDSRVRSPEAINILAIGESSTLGLYCDPKDSYPRQLESMLRAYYDDDRINVVYPPHIGRNTSQMANRMKRYIEVYRPRMVIFMVGANNHWSFSESNIGKFLAAREGDRKDRLKLIAVQVLLRLEDLRVFKIIRHGYLAWAARSDRYYNEQMSQNRSGILGHPDSERWPPKGVINFLLRYSSLKEPLEKLLRHDVGIMVDEARRAHSHVLLMTYAAPSVPVSQLVSLAREHKIPLIRQDLSFRGVFEKKELLDAYFFADHWHPNAKGYSIIARNVFDYIQAHDLVRGWAGTARERLGHG